MLFSFEDHVIPHVRAKRYRLMTIDPYVSDVYVLHRILELPAHPGDHRCIISAQVSWAHIHLMVVFLREDIDHVLEFFVA